MTKRVIASAAVLLALPSCGDGDGGSTQAPIIVSPTAAATTAAPPSPAPAPTPAPTPSPAPTPTPTPTSDNAAKPQLYTVGNLSWSFQGDIPDDIRQRITGAMDWAINQTNTLADYRGNVIVTWHPGTPTAEGGFQYRIQFGGYISWNAAIHELAHWLGSGSIDAWGRNVADGRFTGPITNTRLKAYDGPDAILNADWAHFWPYSYNGDDPFREWQRNVALVAAQRADMGLSDGTWFITGDRRFLNRTSELALDGGGQSEAAPSARTLGDARSLTWKVTYVDGYAVLLNAATGLAIDSLGTTVDGGPVGLRAASDQPRQQWEMIPTEEGWFLLRNRETRKCLDNVGNLAVGAPIRVWGCGRHPNQQWHLVR